MSTTIILVPVTNNVGIKVTAQTLVEAINNNSRATATLLTNIDHNELEHKLSQNRLGDLLEEVVALRENQQNSKDILLMQGLALDDSQPYAMELNYQLATTLNAKIVFILNDSPLRLHAEFARQCQIVAQPYIHNRKEQILGYIINKATAPQTQLIEKYRNFFNINLPLLGCIPQFNNQVPLNIAVLSKYIDINWADRLINKQDEEKLTPALFFYRLMTAARQAQKRIVLPEGDEPRTLQAANICAQRGLAKCVLLATKTSVQQTARQLGITLHQDLVIIEPKDIVDKYVQPLYEIRRNKGLTMEAAQEQLQDNVVLGTMMLQLGDVDGLVSGAVHTTANTIRPAFQIIKTVPDTKIISSVFFVCLPEQILVYGDCAININPTAEELADIAIQSAISAQRFGINPRVALLSYSTGTSGTGPDVEKVRTAYEIAKQKRPDLTIDGPLQYDAAIDPDVAALKAPNSQVAGHANVFIFPDLNSGNIGYKAVQRATNAVCIGPMLQGMRKPVNDLSRGCLVEDIVFTIALTAIQS